ncbi:DUF7409 domain-containing protein [Natronoglomus mannanivorans]|uniref:DUF7409 domain-containing protein n=1 Tax=Natronoglomus mannanivorans TaxID=2979990 RepID=UPI003CCDA475
MSNKNVVEKTRGFATAVDPDAREALEEANVDPGAVVDKTYSYRMLLDAGVDESVADSLRRQFSLPWSYETDGDLDRRSTEVRGLGDEERAWIAASADENWQGFEAARERADATESTDDPADRPWPRPTPVTAVTGVSSENATRLADGGIVSAERLATINAGDVARALDLDVLHVRMWRHNARELVDN